MWSEIRKIKGRMISNSIDGHNDNNDIVNVNVFSDKYMSLYNSLPYNEDEMSKI